MNGLRHGAAIALENVIKSQLGGDYVSYSHEITEQVAILEVKKDTEIERILNPRQYQSIFPGVIRVEAVEIIDGEGTAEES